MGIFGGDRRGQPRNNGELHNLQITEAVFGTCLPILIGTDRLHAKLLFYGGFKATKAPDSGGKGIFGGKATQFIYFADIISGLCQGPTRGLLNVWDQNGKLQNLSGTYIYTVPAGGGSVAPQSNPPIQQDLGVTKASTYTVFANDYGSPGPVTLTGTQQVALTKVDGTPGAGQYSFDGTNYTFSAADAGAEVTISYSAVFSLYYFLANQGAAIPATSPWKISTDNEAYFSQDQGVYFVDNGSAGIKVSGTPSATNEYAEASGVYTFYSGDAGRFVYIRYQYTSNDPNLTNSSHLNLTFFNGAQSQAPWSYMTSKYPGSAFGFTGTCYVGANPMALGESASTPSYNYEIVGGTVFGGGNLDALVADAMELLLTDPLVGVGFPSEWIGDWSLARAYHASNGFFISDTLDTQQPVAQAMQRWLDAGNIAAVWSDGQLKLVPYGDTTTVGNGYTYTPPTTPAFTLTWDDLLPWTDAETGQTTDEDPLQVAQKAPQDCLNYIQAQWKNRANDYNNELTTEQNDAYIAQYGFRPETSQTWDFIRTQTAATWALNLRLKRNCYIRNGYKLKLSYRFTALEPMDLLVLPTGENVRVLQIDDDENGRLTVSGEQWSYGTADVTIYPKQTPSSYQPNTSQAVPGNTSAYIFEATPQSVLAAPNTVQIALAGQQEAWGGCKIYVSTDGSEYSLVDAVTSLNRVGVLSAALPSSADPDNTDTLAIDMSVSGGELVSVTAAQKDSFVSLCAIADPDGTLELVSYETATLTGTDRYNLTLLRRGVYGSTIGAHALGAEFSYLGSTGVFEFHYPAQYAGKTVYFKFASFNLAGNQLQDLSQCVAYPFAIPGSSLQNPSSGVFTTLPANVLSAYTASATDARIDIAAFTATFNGLSRSCNSAGSEITGLNPAQLYYVYYIDLAFQGGAITPVATQNVADFTGKAGYYSLGSIVTPSFNGGGGGGGSTIYRPSSFSDVGSQSTANPSSAYDGSTTTDAVISSRYFSAPPSFQTNGTCVYQGFPGVTTAADTTLTVTAELNVSSSVMQNEIVVNIGGTPHTLVQSTSSAPEQNYTLSIPAGTLLSTISVEISSSFIAASSPTDESASVEGFEIWIQ